jgi:eukaryotic-like serine/threonine-protein kinase
VDIGDDERRRFRRVREILEAAAALQQPERSQYVMDACRDDPGLAKDVREILARDSRTPRILEPGALESAAVSGLDSLEENTPERIGTNRIVGIVGRGGMGIVYEAEDTRLRRRLALKLLSGTGAPDPRGQARFANEARLLATLSHENIATIYSLDEDDGRPFLTMELVRGEDLAKQIRRGPLGLEEALSVGRQIAAALEAAHGRGIVHRDLKPGNVMVTDDERIKVLDFGLATRFHSGDRLAGPTLAGTPGYMSPEQWRAEAVDHRTDLWAFGCVLYECLTGVPALPDSRFVAAFVEEEPE